MMVPPIFQGTLISLHDNDVGIINDPIVVHACHSVFQSEFFKTCYFCEDIMENASFIDAFGEIHLFYCYLSRDISIEFAIFMAFTGLVFMPFFILFRFFVIFVIVTA